ncbi:MAG TPA: DoxX family protein [Candidatus Limnocylindria bacterium]|nr:DoxX family protein [Candidatus Limnocylindria bacterium]
MYITDGRIQVAVAFGRIVIGIIFLWAGLEKVMGVGLGTWNADGFLQFATNGTLGWPFVSGEPAEGQVFNPTHDFWAGVPGTAFGTTIAWLVPLGQMGIGVGLILGLLTRFSAAMGTLMMLFFFVAAWDFEFGIVNQHLTYAVVTFGLAVVGAGNYYGLDRTVGQQVSPGLRWWLFSGDPHDTLPMTERPAGSTA